MMKNDEKERVIERSKEANYAEGVMRKTTSYCGDLFRHFIVEGSILELGPAEGVMTDLLSPFFDDYTVVDGADFFVDDIVKRHPHIHGCACLFEDYRPERQFNNIILGHVLEHVDDPVEIIKMCRKWLKREGRILAAVPNSNSIHRQAAVKMGLLEHEKQLNSTDIKNGHRRVYDMDALKADFLSAGCTIIESGGYWLKPLSNAQIDASWDNEMIDAFLRLGEKYPDIAGEIYVIASSEVNE